MQDAAVHEILDLVRSIDTAQRIEAKGRAILAGYMHGYCLTRLKVGHACDREAVVAIQAKAVAVLTFHKLERKYAHADEV